MPVTGSTGAAGAGAGDLSLAGAGLGCAGGVAETCACHGSGGSFCAVRWTGADAPPAASFGPTTSVQIPVATIAIIPPANQVVLFTRSNLDIPRPFPLSESSSLGRHTR